MPPRCPWMFLLFMRVTKPGILHTLSHFNLITTPWNQYYIATLHTSGKQTTRSPIPESVFLTLHSEPNILPSFYPYVLDHCHKKNPQFSLLSTIGFCDSFVEVTLCFKLRSIIPTDCYLYYISSVPEKYRCIRTNPLSPLGKPSTCVFQSVCAFRSLGHHTPGMCPWTVI